ncbi:MAG TPA: hypothetical protein VEC39_03430 [Vicinamibacterales bacterium]|nr:hypothetical protein [Vicinamibacterales bacterium]
MKRALVAGVCVLALAMPSIVLAQTRSQAPPPGATKPIKVKPGAQPPQGQKPDGTPGLRGGGQKPNGGGTKGKKG